MQESVATATRIKALRKTAGLSQNQVADALGIDRSAYTYFENGDTDIKLERLLRIAKIFNVGVDQLLSPECLTPALGARSEEETKMYAAGKDEKSLLAMFRQLSPDAKEELLALGREKCKDM